MNFKSVKNEDNAIILSAHCDDIPLSLGGCLIGKLFVRSPNVIVVFSITNYILGEEQAHSSEEITRIRIEEENKAAKLSNYHVRFLGFKDAICRPFYSNYSSLFHEDPVINDPIYPQVKRELKKILVNYGGIICSPLSIGNHVDHRILHHFTLELMNDNPNIPFLFYEDLPYASYIEKSKQEEIIYNLKKSTDIKPYIFRNFDIKKKIKLLKIYKSQMNKEHIEMVEHYWDFIGKGERIWLTESANKFLHNENIDMS